MSIILVEIKSYDHLQLIISYVFVKKSINLIRLFKSKRRCRPSKGRRFIPDVDLKNELTLYALTGRIRPVLPKFQF